MYGNWNSLQNQNGKAPLNAGSIHKPHIDALHAAWGLQHKLAEQHCPNKHLHNFNFVTVGVPVDQKNTKYNNNINIHHTMIQWSLV